MTNLTIEIYIEGQWRTAGELEITDPTKGRKGRVYFGYNVDYAIDQQHAPDCHAVSLNYPISLANTYPSETWFAFLEDIMPAGASRKWWINKLDLGKQSEIAEDFPLLKYGTLSPVGNLRIRESLPNDLPKTLTFPSDYVTERDSDFLSYAQEMGAASGGASGAGGEAPKLLLRLNENDEVWIDALQNQPSNLDQHYLIKFPRGSRSQIDQDILRTEYYFYQELAELGIDTVDTQKLMLKEGTKYPSLWLPRFDVDYTNNYVDKWGLESIYSLVNKGAGSFLNHFEVIQRLTDLLVPNHYETKQELVTEYLKRDLLNICFGNSDNHGRNMAILKTPESCKLSPVYDFAPMRADPEGISRTTKWGPPYEVGGEFKWKDIANNIQEIDSEELLNNLQNFTSSLKGLKTRLEERGVPKNILNMPTFGWDTLDKKLERWGLLV